VLQLLMAAFEFRQLSLLCSDNTCVLLEFLNFFRDEAIVEQCRGRVAVVGVVAGGGHVVVVVLIPLIVRVY